MAAEVFQVQFKNMKSSEALSNEVLEQVEGLDQYHGGIISCHVVISLPHQRQHLGKIFHVHIRLHVPGGELVVSSEPEKDQAHEDPYIAIRDTFDSLRRQLEEFIRCRRGFVKHQEKEPHAKVIKLFQGDGYGFLTTIDFREIYFHENAVVNNEFKKLHIGDEVRFCEEMGEKGPQATSVVRVGRNGHFTPRLP